MSKHDSFPYDCSLLQMSSYDNDRTVTDWRDMPLTISSEIEGWRMENIHRIDDRITANDFLDRMPSDRDGEAPLVRTVLLLRVLGVNNANIGQTIAALGNRRGRFRAENGLAAWNNPSVASTQIFSDSLTQYQRDNSTTRVGLTFRLV